MSNNLPSRASGAMPPAVTGVGASAPLPFTREWSLARRTRNNAQEIVAAGYEQALADSINADRAVRKVQTAVELEETYQDGLIALGNNVERQLASSGPLARQLLSEALPGSVGRIGSVVATEFDRLKRS